MAAAAAAPQGQLVSLLQQGGQGDMAAFQGGLLPAQIKPPVEAEAAREPSADHQPERIFDPRGRAARDFRAGKGIHIVLDMHGAPEARREVCRHGPAIEAGDIGGRGAALAVQKAAQPDADRPPRAGFLIGLLHRARHGVQKLRIVAGRRGPPLAILQLQLPVKDRQLDLGAADIQAVNHAAGAGSGTSGRYRYILTPRTTRFTCPPGQGLSAPTPSASAL